ncbi:MAG: IS66 family transposase, partial [Myxococcota bacterium]|nr:IS66 family transposase [Myxococcota bacterium]
MKRVTDAASEARTTTELRGSVLEVVRELHAGGRSDELLAVVSKLVSRNEELERLVTTLRESKNRGEHISLDQLDLFLNKLRELAGGELVKADEKLAAMAKENGERPEKTKPPKQPAVRRPPPPGARRVPNVLKVPEGERPCPRCGGERECIGHTTTEVIDFIPAEVIVRLDMQELLSCKRCEREVEQGPIGDKVAEGGAYGSCLVAHLVIGKYWDSQPLNRLGQGLERLGLSMPSSSMADQIHWATDLLRPIWWKLQEGVLKSPVMHLDGTGLAVRDQDSPRGIVTGTLWGYVGIGDGTQAVYLYTSTGKKVGQRAGEVGPEDFLRRRTGYTVADAASIFDLSFKRPELIEIACNMHARRYFVKALDANDARAAVPIAAFQALYAVEEAVRDADDETRREERQRRSKPVYDELIAWCETYRPMEPPSSLLSKAMGYLLNHRLALTRFLDAGVIPIDNGIVERLHRRPAIGRRNFLFAGSHAGAERAAIAYSVLASCHLAGVNPNDYLADVLPRLARGGISVARDIPPMLPAAWKRDRAGPAAPTA